MKKCFRPWTVAVFLMIALSLAIISGPNANAADVRMDLVKQSTLEDISGLVGGTYTVTVTDLDSDCFVTQMASVTELASPITVVGTITDNTKCNAVFDY